MQTLMDWLFDDFFPIFLTDEQLTAKFFTGQHTLEELFGLWFVVGVFATPALIVYFAIKKGRRLF